MHFWLPSPLLKNSIQLHPWDFLWEHLCPTGLISNMHCTRTTFSVTGLKKSLRRCNILRNSNTSHRFNSASGAAKVFAFVFNRIEVALHCIGCRWFLSMLLWTRKKIQTQVKRNLGNVEWKFNSHFYIWQLKPAVQFDRSEQWGEAAELISSWIADIIRAKWTTVPDQITGDHISLIHKHIHVQERGKKMFVWHQKETIAMTCAVSLARADLFLDPAPAASDTFLIKQSWMSTDQQLVNFLLGEG